MMVEPTEKMQDNYKYLLSLEEDLIAAMKDGVKLNDLYEKIKNKCQADRPELVEKLTPNFGYETNLKIFEIEFVANFRLRNFKTHTH